MRYDYEEDEPRRRKQKRRRPDGEAVARTKRRRPQRDDYDDEYSYVSNDMFAADARVSERVSFIQKTYAHLAGAILLFVIITGTCLNVAPIRDTLLSLMLGGGSSLIIFGIFIAATFVADRLANSDSSPAVQYAGLGLYTVAYAVFFIPLLAIAQMQTGDSGIIFQAGFLTLLIFGGLSVFVFVTKSDFSFMGPFLTIAGLAAFGIIILGAIFGFSLGIFFVCGMIVLMSGYILYDTSNVLHHYRTDQHVAASLALFASVATLFWYVLRLAMILAED